MYVHGLHVYLYYIISFMPLFPFTQNVHRRLSYFHGHIPSLTCPQNPARYEFQWDVRNADGADFGHREARSGDFTEGSYFVQLPDTRTQTVNYRVDGHSGFVADVQYEGEAQYPSGDGEGVRYDARGTDRMRQQVLSGAEGRYQPSGNSQAEPQNTQILTGYQEVTPQGATRDLRQGDYQVQGQEQSGYQLQGQGLNGNQFQGQELNGYQAQEQELKGYQPLAQEQNSYQIQSQQPNDYQPQNQAQNGYQSQGRVQNGHQFQSQEQNSYRSQAQAQTSYQSQRQEQYNQPQSQEQAVYRPAIQPQSYRPEIQSQSKYQPQNQQQSLEYQTRRVKQTGHQPRGQRQQVGYQAQGVSEYQTKPQGQSGRQGQDLPQEVVYQRDPQVQLNYQQSEPQNQSYQFPGQQQDISSLETNVVFDDYV